MDPREADRRQGDRRHNDRRSLGRRREDTAASTFDPGWLASGDLPSDSRFLDRQTRRVARAQDTAFARVYRTYTAARAGVGVCLVAVHGVSSLMGLKSSEWLALVSLAYAAQAIMLWMLPRFGSLALPFSQARHRRRLLDRRRPGRRLQPLLQLGLIRQHLAHGDA